MLAILIHTSDNVLIEIVRVFLAMKRIEIRRISLIRKNDEQRET